MKGKRVLVTGAGGFIGSHLCEALVSAGAEVTALVRYNGRSDRGSLELVPADVLSSLRVVFGAIEDPFAVDQLVKGHEVVFHLAALIAIPYSYTNPSSYVRTNVDGTLNVLEAVRRHGVERLVHTSTSEAYGTALYTPIDEKHPLQAQSPYAASKIAADKLAESYHRSFDVPVATIRPFNTFGPRQSARAVIPTIVSQALSKPEVRLGSLTPIRDLTYVADTVAGFLAVARAPEAVGEVTNVGQGKGISIGDLARLILELVGRDLPIVQEDARLRPQASEVHQLLCDPRKAHERLGWSPAWDLRRGLTQVIEFVRANLARFHAGAYVR